MASQQQGLHTTSAAQIQGSVHRGAHRHLRQTHRGWAGAQDVVGACWTYVVVQSGGMIADNPAGGTVQQVNGAHTHQGPGPARLYLEDAHPAQLVNRHLGQLTDRHGQVQIPQPDELGQQIVPGAKDVFRSHTDAALQAFAASLPHCRGDSRAGVVVADEQVTQCCRLVLLKHHRHGHILPFPLAHSPRHLVPSPAGVPRRRAGLLWPPAVLARR